MGYVAGERLIGGEFYRPIDEYKGRELLQSEPEPRTGHHSYCVRLISSPATIYIGSETHALGYPNQTKGSAESFIAMYRRLIDRYGFYGGDDAAVADFQRRVVESIEDACRSDKIGMGRAK